MKTNEQIGRAIRERLAAQAAANHASGERLYAVIRAVWIQHPDYTAKLVIRLLPPEFQSVSVRHAQALLKRARAESSA
jgi:hypothetical protein